MSDPKTVAPSCRTEFVASWNDWEGAVCVALEDYERVERELAAANERADKAEDMAKHSLPFTVQYMRQDASDVWHDMAAFDFEAPALKYAKERDNETWKYRVIKTATDEATTRA